MLNSAGGEFGGVKEKTKQGCQDNIYIHVLCLSKIARLILKWRSIRVRLHET